MKTVPGRRFVAAAALIFALAVLAAFLLTGESRDSEKAAGPKEGPASPHASGYTVTLSPEAQRAGDITTETLKPVLYRRQVSAYGKVLSSDRLNALRDTYVAGAAGLEKAEAELKNSEKEYERMKVLNASAKNVSDRALQAAAARLAADIAENARARGTLQSAKDAITLEWGPILSGWIFDYSAQLRRILDTRDVLVKVTVPPTLRLQSPPRDVRIEPPIGGSISARFVSRATSTDPQIQGISFIYVAPSSSGKLVPGMNVTAQMPSTVAQTGFFISVSSVVWLQEKAWVYVKKSQTGFSRVEVPTSSPFNNGYFVSGILDIGDQVVTKGAQALLSEESTPRTTGGGGAEEDED